MKEQLLKIVGRDPADVVQQLKDNDVRVLHRCGDVIIVEGEPTSVLPAEALRDTRAIAVEPLVETPTEVRNEDIALLAFRLRQTEDFRRSREERAIEGEDWGEIFKSL